MGYKRKEKEAYLKIWLNLWSAFEPLNMEQRGKVLTAMMSKARNEEPPPLDALEAFAFHVLAARMDEDTEHYKSVCNNRSNPDNQQPEPPKPTKAAEVDKSIQKPTKAAEVDLSDQKQKQKQKQNSHISSSAADSACARDADLARAVNYYAQHINPTYGQMEREGIVKAYQQFGAEAVIYAIDKALAANKAAWNYIRAIFNGWVKQGVKSLADAQRLDIEHRERVHSKTSGGQNVRPPGKSSVGKALDDMMYIDQLLAQEEQST